MTFNLYRLIKYHLYLLQLENYELGRFWKLLIKRGWFQKKDQRKDLVWTMKARILFAGAIVLHIIFGFLFYFSFHLALVLSIFLFFLLFVLYPVLFTLALIFFFPFDWLAKKIIIGKAKSKIRWLSSSLDPGYFSRQKNGPNMKNSGMEPVRGLKIIGIAGSYGKTTMKEVLKQVLSIKYKVLSTPESVNTPVGIARWILKEVDDTTQIIIVEMGEHYRGDVKELCGIARPDISVVTGINEAHLERMKTLDNVVSTIFEIVSGSKPKSLVMLNGDDELVMKHYKEFIWPDHKVEKFSAKGGSASGGQISNFKFQKFNAEKLVWEAEAEGIGKFNINLLGEYALGDVYAAIKIGQGLGMSVEEIKKGIANIKPVSHRLQPVRGGGDVLIIDDAYNGNPAGATEAIKVLSRFPDRRKVYITPGLVEMGKSAADVHRKIGQQLAGVTDVVILIKNSVTPFIEEGIQSSSKLSAVSCQLLWFNTAQEAHLSLGKILKPGDVVVFQNDWGDNYL